MKGYDTIYYKLYGRDNVPFWFMASYVLMLVIGVGLGILLYRRDLAGKKRKRVDLRRFFKAEGEREER